MKQSKSKLVFAADRKSLQIKFYKGRLSSIITSKKVAIEVVAAARYEQIISDHNFTEMIVQIIGVDDLPWVPDTWQEPTFPLNLHEGIIFVDEAGEEV